MHETRTTPALILFTVAAGTVTAACMTAPALEKEEMRASSSALEPTEKLPWAPPTLGAEGRESVTMNITAGGTYNLDTKKDYRLELPKDRAVSGPLKLRGGHHIVIIGGEVSVSNRDPNVDGDRKCFDIADQTGTVHIEGVRTGPETSDAFSMASPAATVQIQNARVDRLHGQQSGAHADLIQPWGGVKILRVHRVTALTDYQGIYLQQDYNCPGYAGKACNKSASRATTYEEITIQNVNIRSTGAGAHYSFWHTDAQDFPVKLDNVWLEPGAYQFGNSVWPHDNFKPESMRAVVKDGNSATWPNYVAQGRAQIAGAAHKGVPPMGDFVPDDPKRLGGVGVPGFKYVSPGYVTDAPKPAPTAPAPNAPPDAGAKNGKDAAASFDAGPSAEDPGETDGADEMNDEADEMNDEAEEMNDERNREDARATQKRSPRPGSASSDSAPSTEIGGSPAGCSLASEGASAGTALPFVAIAAVAVRRRRCRRRRDEA